MLAYAIARCLPAIVIGLAAYHAIAFLASLIVAAFAALH